MKRDELKKAAREALEKLIRDVEAGISETLKQYLKAMGRFHRYSVGNAILIQMQKPDATHVAGFYLRRRLHLMRTMGRESSVLSIPSIRSVAGSCYWSPCDITGAKTSSTTMIRMGR